MKKIVFSLLVVCLIVGFSLPARAGLTVNRADSVRVAEADFMELLLNNKFEEIEQILTILIVQAEEVEKGEVAPLFYKHGAEEIIIYYELQQ